MVMNFNYFFFCKWWLERLYDFLGERIRKSYSLIFVILGIDLFLFYYLVLVYRVGNILGKELNNEDRKWR